MTTMASNGDLITVEYAGEAPRQVGTYPMHDVRAWWVVRDEGSEGRVKQAAGRELKRHITADHVEFVHADTDTYNSPHMNSMMTFRVLTRDQFTARAEMRSRVYRLCDWCRNRPPCSLLRMADNQERPVCYTCQRGPELEGVAYVTMAWVKGDGKLQV